MDVSAFCIPDPTQPLSVERFISYLMVLSLFGREKGRLLSPSHPLLAGGKGEMKGCMAAPLTHRPGPRGNTGGVSDGLALPAGSWERDSTLETEVLLA